VFPVRGRFLPETVMSCFIRKYSPAPCPGASTSGKEIDVTVPKLLKGYAEELGFPESAILFKIFNILYDGQDDIKLLSAMPGNAEVISQKTGIPFGIVHIKLDHLWKKGAVMKITDQFFLIPGLIALRDMSIMWPQSSQEYFELWEDMFTKEHHRFVAHMKKKNYPSAMRVVPVEEAVDSRNQILDIDSAVKIFKDAELISAVPCACRLQATKVGRRQNCPAPETANCLATNMIAAMVLSRDIGTKISQQEALKRLAEAEDAGLVHMARNNVKKDMFMCNCCACCCHGLEMINDGSYTEAFAPSRFQVRFDADACSGCGECVARCQFKAISLSDIAEVDLGKCFGCGNCAAACPTGALVLTEFRPIEHIRTSSKVGSFG
jgi:ferredoxin